MKIAVVNWTRRQAGGVEIYISRVVRELSELGHEIAYLHELDEPVDREPVFLPQGAPAWCISAIGEGSALRELKTWKPDLIFSHSLVDTSLEAKTLDTAPGVFFAHAYYGTCISGSKSFKYPNIEPCSRAFGWQCLVQYYPRHCGGWNPVSMVREYRRQQTRLDHLMHYRAIVTFSGHMRNEYLRQGFAPEKIFSLYGPECLGSLNIESLNDSASPANLGLSQLKGIDRRASEPLQGPLRLLYLGRLDVLKGVQILLDAVRVFVTKGHRPVHLTIAGEGRDQEYLRNKALEVEASTDGLEIEFQGWLKSGTDRLLAQSDLLVLPSVWPEPFGLVGLEAARLGIPVAAFAVGGIRDWLVDGVNGFSASADPPTADGLAEAIEKCVLDQKTYSRLRRGSALIAERFTPEAELKSLLNIFDAALHSTSLTESRPMPAPSAKMADSAQVLVSISSKSSRQVIGSGE